ncbi:hypothetical protein SAMN02949497_1504 [Methylomagnum ishizawai]|uniref:DUF2157 domain-containing protein n=1 Tax=Methylomagnum ishizawai TaxID=1760988 RepID=A0A1Y6D2I6_9GAMM|nr:hypothetical protein [Methylomagnum ishizawai]SMF94195.1 hypothetical protein SAMN02949497_1504 [Methylomagnum ishizawai]
MNLYDSESQDRRESPNYRPGFYLRLLGTAILLLAMADFLVQGLNGLTPNYRYWIMPGFSLLLALCGLVCGYLWHDHKGARLFFALAAALVPVQFTQLGALIYAPPVELAGSALLLGDLALSLGVALPVAYLAFSILAKPRRASLLTELFLGCALFLLPSREPEVVAVLCLGLFGLLRLGWVRQRQDALMQAGEGVAALALAHLPLIIMIGRSAFLPWSWITTAALLTILAVVLFVDAARAGLLGGWAEPMGALAAFLALNCLLLALPVGVGGFGGWTAHALGGAALLFALGQKSLRQGPALRGLGTLLALLGCFLCLAVRRDHAAAMLFLAVGTALVYAGIAYRQRWVLFAGIVGYLAGAIFYARFTVNLYQASPWLTMIGLGIGILLFASFLEKQRKPLMEWGQRWWRTVNAWGR